MSKIMPRFRNISDVTAPTASSATRSTAASPARQEGSELSGLSYARLLFYSRLADQSQKSAQLSTYSLKNPRPYERLSVKLFATELQASLQKNSDLTLPPADSKKLGKPLDNNFAATLKRSYKLHSTSFKVKRLKFKQIVKDKT